ncbi:MerR family transcriptional regulator [Nocardia inohanensis]|uniref:MerR family transcriptional regulator n=1 Tax=Nocardia inohanensis TaxID=209246 RepID=UPI000831150E|nr:MerR family transcriptional regulator [Nocardia inohanensis]
MTDSTQQPGLLSIGELARRTELPVRTIRFYCDEGILESHRSTGGHRLFDADTATARLLLVRRLRTLGLGLTAITEVLQGERSIDEVIAAETIRLDTEFNSLAWRRASLRALGSADLTQRPERLALLAAAQDGTAAHDRLIQFWRRLLTTLTVADFNFFACGNIPEPPADPSVEQIVAYAELTALVSDPDLYYAMGQQLWRTRPQTIRDRRALFFDVGCLLVEVIPFVAANTHPHPGPELDRFVAAHAKARNERDSREFRNHLLANASDADRRIRRYWTLTADLLDTSATVGQAHHWLYEALTGPDEAQADV